MEEGGLGVHQAGLQHVEEHTVAGQTDRREGKGRRCCLGDGINSIPCPTTDLKPG